MQVVCSHSIQHHVEAAALYELLKLVMLCGWCCCHSCFCWTASCWDWSEVDRRFIRGDTQFAGMIKPVISKKNLWSRVQQKHLNRGLQTSLPQKPHRRNTGLKLFLRGSQMHTCMQVRSQCNTISWWSMQHTTFPSTTVQLHQPYKHHAFFHSVRCKICLL